MSSRLPAEEGRLGKRVRAKVERPFFCLPPFRVQTPNLVLPLQIGRQLVESHTSFFSSPVETLDFAGCINSLYASDSSLFVPAISLLYSFEIGCSFCSCSPPARHLPGSSSLPSRACCMGEGQGFRLLFTYASLFFFFFFFSLLFYLIFIE